MIQILNLIPIPGHFGGLNEGVEKPVNCFIRELNEEIGIKFKAEEVITLYDYFNEEFQTHRFVFYMLSEKPSRICFE